MAQTKLMIGYLPGYAISTRGYDLTKTPADLLTHLIYCFAKIDDDGRLILPEERRPKNGPARPDPNLDKLVLLKRAFPSLNVILGVGGSGNAVKKAFSDLVKNRAKRDAFVQSCAACVGGESLPLQFDGIDLDWEFPESAERDDVTALVHAIRNQLNVEGRRQGRHLFTSLAVGVTEEQRRGIDMPAVQVSLDWFGVMAYSIHVPKAQGGKTDYDAPLFTPTNDPKSIENGVSSIPAEILHRKVVLGIHAYAQSYGDVAPTNHGIRQPYTKLGPGTYHPDDGRVSFAQVMSDYVNDPSCQVFWDASTASSSLFCAGKGATKPHGAWLSPTLERDLDARVAFAEQRKCGGLMLWELGADRIGEGSLVAMMARALR
jgi:chitinase